MSANFKPPKNLVFDTNIEQNYQKFKSSFEIYMKASGLDSKADDVKVAIFFKRCW